MKILFACLGGMTSSLLAAKLKEHLESEGYSVKCQGIITEQDVKRVIQSETDYTIAYMHIMGLTVPNRKRISPAFDRVLIAPQAAYLLPKVKAAAEETVPEDHYVMIPGKAYRNVDVAEIYKLIL